MITRPRGKGFVASDGAVVWQLIGGEGATIKTHSVAYGYLEPGQIGRRHFHIETDETLYVVEGSGIVYLNGAPHPIRTGDCIEVPRGTTHGLHNTNAKYQLRVLAICSPPYREDDVYYPEEV